LLLTGAELFVRGGGRVALGLRVPSEIVAMTVVAVGTSLPEILVAATAALGGQPALALGSVVGSHVAGLALVLGTAALRHPLRSDVRLLRREVPAILALQAATGAFALDGTLGRLDGLALLGIGAVYAGVLARDARAGRSTPERRRPDRAADPFVSATLLALGLALAGAGAQVLVHAATGAVAATGLSPRVIGLTLVALVTTGPEIVAAVAGGFEEEIELALPHALGASVLGWSVALGGTAVLRPVAVAGATAYEDLAVAVVATLLLVPMMLGGPRLTRPEGGVLAGVWAIWTTWLLGGPR
jgi:cation:H+ antiporter